MAAVPGLR